MNSHHIIASINEDVGGPAISTTRLIQSLNLLGIPSFLHSLDYRRHGALSAPDLGPFPVAGWTAQITRGWSPKLARQLDRHLTTHPGIIHNHGCWMIPNIYARRAAQTHHLPHITSPRGMLEPWAMGFHSLKKRAAWLLYESSNLSAANAFHATSESEMNSIRDLGFRQPVYVIPNGVDLPSTFSPSKTTSPPAPSPYFLFLSRLHPKKGLELLLRSWNELHANYPDWKLVIAGPDLDHYRKTLLLKFPQSAHLNSILWKNAVQGEEKHALLHNASFLVLPSYSENFGIVVAEALSHQTPVLTTDRTPWQDLHRRGCGWIIAPDQDQLTCTLQQALSTPQPQLEIMGRQGQSWMKDSFSWNRIASAMAETYQHLSGSGPKPDFIVES